MAEKNEKPAFLTYKGRPLVRSGNVLYYGDMAEKCVIMLQILSTKTLKDMTMADKVHRNEPEDPGPCRCGKV